MISGGGLAVRNVLFKVVNPKVDAAFASLLLALAMALASGAYYIYQRTVTGAPLIPPTADPKAIWLAAAAGFGVAFANITLAYTYKMGGQVSLTALLQNGFSLTMTIVIGALLLGEVITLKQFMGIALVFGGIFLITK